METDLIEVITNFITTHVDVTLFLFLTFLGYLTLLFIVRWVHLRCYVKIPFNVILKISIEKFGKFYSPDYYTASVFKSLSGYNNNKIVANYYQTIYVKTWNKTNIYVSFFYYLILLIAFSNNYFFSLLFGFSFVRFFSRCSEISIAFFHDVINKPEKSIYKRNTFLTKYERIHLAAVSYVEIYFLSAAMYLTIKPSSENCLNSIVDSLSVGSLTNVGRVVSGPSTSVDLYVFVQVFTTLVLIIMSLAVYVGREK